MESKQYKLSGIASSFEVGKGGARFKNSSGVIEVRNNADGSYAFIRQDGSYFNLTPSTGSIEEGKAYYDADWKTLNLGSSGSVQIRMNFEDLRLVYNNTGSPIAAGTPVYTTGSYTGGTVYVATISSAKADSATTFNVLGCTILSIANASYGIVMVRGHIFNLNTAAYAAGDQLYLSGTVAGGLQNTAPDVGYYRVRVARVIRSDAALGILNIRVMDTSRLEDLANVQASSPSVNDVLKWNGSYWVNGAGGSGGSGVGPGATFWFDDTHIIPLSANNVNEVNTLIKAPNATGEVVDAWANTGATALGEAYLYNTALGLTSIPGGTWEFNSYASVSSVAGGRVSYLTRSIRRVRPAAVTVTMTGAGTSRTATASGGTPFAVTEIDTGGTLVTDSYLQTPLGLYRITARTSDTVVTISTPNGYANESGVAFSVWKNLFYVNGQTITTTGTNYALYAKYSSQATFSCATTDKLGCIMYHTSNNTTTVNFVHNGTANNSNFISPLIALHNDLAGLQGGTGSGVTGQFYHLQQLPSPVVDGQMVLFDGTSGSKIKADTLTGIPKGASGVYSAAIADTDYLAALSSINGFRLTPTTGTPVIIADVSSATIIYCSPYLSNKMAVWNGSAVVVLTSNEFSYTLAGRTADLPFDVFCYSNAGTLTLEVLDWTNATTRATGVSWQNGMWAKTGDATRRYLGTCRPRTATTYHFRRFRNGTTDFPALDLWNASNRVNITFGQYDSGSSFNYTTATIRQWRASTNYQIDIVVGLSKEYIDIESQALVYNAGNIDRIIGMGYDSTSSYVDAGNQIFGTSFAAGAFCTINRMVHQPEIGRHYYSYNQYSVASGTSTWYPSSGVSSNVSCYVGTWSC